MSNYTTYNRDFVKNLKSQLTDMGVNSSDTETIGGHIFNLLQGESEFPGCEFDDFIGAGTFKEVYQVGNWVVKFAIDNPESHEEAQAYTSIDSQILCPTLCIPIPAYNNIPLDNWMTIPDYQNYTDPTVEADNELWPRAAYIIIQPVALVAAEQGDDINPNDPIFAPAQWLQSIKDFYGEEGYNSILESLDELNITDLSPWNVGYLDGRPVIFDYLTA